MKLLKSEHYRELFSKIVFLWLYFFFRPVCVTDWKNYTFSGPFFWILNKYYFLIISLVLDQVNTTNRELDITLSHKSA